jgi:hypothetical protein
MFLVQLHTDITFIKKLHVNILILPVHPFTQQWAEPWPLILCHVSEYSYLRNKNSKQETKQNKTAAILPAALLDVTRNSGLGFSHMYHKHSVSSWECDMKIMAKESRTILG